MLIVHPLAPEARVMLEGEVLPLEPALEARVAAAWEKERARRPGLSDGRMCAVDTVTPALIRVRASPYRRFAASRADPELGRALGLRVLAVSGLLACDGGIVFGRRAATVTQDADLWELVPSGGVEPGDRAEIDVAAELLRELREEVGIEAGEVAPPQPFCLVEDVEAGVLDLCMAITTRLDTAAIFAAHRRLGRPEYSELAIVPEAELAAFAASRPVVRVTRMMLSARRLLDPE